MRYTSKVDMSGFGPVTIAEAESTLGKATTAIMDMEGHIVYDSPEVYRTVFYALGYAWDCGCEIRGSAPFYRWIPCRHHSDLAAEGRSVASIDEAYRHGAKVPIEEAYRKNLIARPQNT